MTAAAPTLATLTRRDFLTLTPTTPIRRASAQLLDAQASAAPVIDDSGALVGILTQKDCFRPALHASYHQEWKGSVADHMSRTMVCLPYDTDLTSAAEAFLTHPHRVLPVLEGARLLGLLHRSDVLAALLRWG